MFDKNFIFKYRARQLKATETISKLHILIAMTD